MHKYFIPPQYLEFHVKGGLLLTSVDRVGMVEMLNNSKEGNWSSLTSWDANVYKVSLTIDGITREGISDVQKKASSYEVSNNITAGRAAETSAMFRALSMFGIGLYFYDIPKKAPPIPQHEDPMQNEALADHPYKRRLFRYIHMLYNMVTDKRIHKPLKPYLDMYLEEKFTSEAYKIVKPYLTTVERNTFIEYKKREESVKEGK